MSNLDLYHHPDYEGPPPPPEFRYLSFAHTSEMCHLGDRIIDANRTMSWSGAPCEGEWFTVLLRARKRCGVEGLGFTCKQGLHGQMVVKKVLDGGRAEYTAIQEGMVFVGWSVEQDNPFHTISFMWDGHAWGYGKVLSMPMPDKGTTVTLLMYNPKNK